MKDILKKKRFYIALVSISLFLLIMVLILKKGVLNIDNSVYYFIKENLISDEITNYIKIFTNLGGALVLIILSLILMFLLKNKKDGLAILINLITSFLLNLLMKIIFLRERPGVNNWLVEEIGYSFPSGHATVSMAFYGFLIYLAYIKIKNRQTKYWIISILSIVILFIGVSRVYLGVHYLSDILGGFLFSIFYLVIFITIYDKFSSNSTIG